MQQRNNNNKIKYFLYARKSSEAEDRQIASIDAQIDELKKRAVIDGLKVIEVFCESMSAKEPGRPVFNKMIDRIKQGEAEGILCWKLDRLARNPVDGGEIQWMLQCNQIKHIQTFERSYLSSDNILMMNVEFGMANQFIRDLSANVKRGNRKRASMGWVNLAPTGYKNSPDIQSGCNIIIKDPDRYAFIRQMWDLMLTGNYTIPKIEKIMREEFRFKTIQRRHLGGKSMSKSGIHRIFTNPFYYGYFERPIGSGDWYKGAHEPMITQDEYDRVQIILGRKGKPRPKHHNFAFTGLLRCGSCGCAITAEIKTKRQKNGNVHEYVYYHCTKKKDKNCTEKCIEVKELESQIDKILSTLTISEGFKNWAIKYLHEIRTNEADNQEKIISTKHKELDSTIKQVDSLLLKYTSPENINGSLISNEEYQVLKSQLLKKKSILEDELKIKGKEVNEWVELTEKTFDFATYARIWFEKGDLQTKKNILSCLGQNLTIKDQKISLDIYPYLQSIIKNKDEVEAEIKKVRTSKNVESKRKNRDLVSALPALQGRKDSNPQDLFWREAVYR